MIKRLVKVFWIIFFLATLVLTAIGITEYQYYQSLSADAKEIYKATRLGW